jgi:hypothetical protein
MMLCLVTLSPLKAQEVEACDHPETLLTEAIAESPERLLTVLEGKRLQAFFSNLRAQGRLAGSLPLVERVYIVTAKMLHPDTDPPHVWLFFIQKGCILVQIPALREVIEDALPPEPLTS